MVSVPPDPGSTGTLELEARKLAPLSAGENGKPGSVVPVKGRLVAVIRSAQTYSYGDLLELEGVLTAPGAGGRGNAALGAAPTAIPGVVFEGSGDGRLFAVSATDGSKLWEFNTAQDFKTVNNVPAHGGAIATAGAVIVDGMVYVGSGYAISSGASGGNVLLAFGLD